MRATSIAAFVVAAATVLMAGRYARADVVSALVPPQQARTVPALQHQAPSDWLNSTPLTWDDFKDSVVLLDFWTFACWNCYRSFPWLTDLEARYADQGLRVLGVHSPEFEHERDRTSVARKIREYGLKHPVMIDNDFTFWKAIGNEYWPTYYLIDRAGRIRAVYAGETHVGDAQARRIEADLKVLLTEQR